MEECGGTRLLFVISLLTRCMRVESALCVCARSPLTSAPLYLPWSQRRRAVMCYFLFTVLMVWKPDTEAVYSLKWLLWKRFKMIVFFPLCNLDQVFHGSLTSEVFLSQSSLPCASHHLCVLFLREFLRCMSAFTHCLHQEVYKSS